MSGRTAFDLALAQALIDRKRDTPGATLPILHDLQEQFGYIDDAAIPLIADALNISQRRNARRRQLLSRLSPLAGRWPRVLKLCRAESCQSMGCEDLVSHLELRHGIKVDDDDNHSGLHVETVYCLGNCALSPAALLDGEPIGRLDRDRIDAIVAAAQGKTQ